MAVLTLLAGWVYRVQPAWAFGVMGAFALAALWVLPKRAGEEAA